MICNPCREQSHEKCLDLPRMNAVLAGEVPAVTDASSSQWCYCHHKDSK